MTYSRIIALAILAAAPAIAQESVEYTERDRRGLTEMVNTFSRCSGVYEAVSEFYRSLGELATAEHVHNLANGAASAAMYLLGQENIAKGGPPRPYGDFMPYVEGLADSSKTFVKALVEMQATEEVLKHFQDCAALVEAQEAALQALRDDANNR